MMRPSSGSHLFDLSALHPKSRSANEALIRGLCQYAYLGDQVGVCRMLGRYKIYVDTLDSGLAPHLMLDGYWEMWVTEAIAALVKPGMVVGDVGANVGYFSLMMAELVGPQGRVHAFEPNPEIAALLQRSLMLNGFWYVIEVHPDPLADEDGRLVELHVPQLDPKNAHITPARPEGERTSSVYRTRRLDSDPRWREMELVKIDADGSEALIWDGMGEMLAGRTLKTVIIEFAAARYTDPPAFLDRLAGHGFSLAYIDERKGVLPATAAQILASPPVQDWMLILQR